MFFHPELFERLDRVDADNVMQNWYEPYWTLARTVCRMDGGEGQKHKSIELGKKSANRINVCPTLLHNHMVLGFYLTITFLALDATLAALMALEQIEVGSLIHLGILCDTAEESLRDDDAALALQNPYVALFVQRFLERNRCIEELTESQLNGCAMLVRSAAGNLEKGLLELAVEGSFTRAEEVVKRRRPAPPTTMDGLQPSDPTDQSLTLEKDAQTLLTVRVSIVTGRLVWMILYSENLWHDSLLLIFLNIANHCRLCKISGFWVLTSSIVRRWR